MTERPILMCGDMVRATMAELKTETRRVINPQPPFGCSYVINGAYSHALCHHTDGKVWVPPTAKSKDHRLPCLYGQPGDRLWVKETHWLFGRWKKNGKTKSGKQAWTFYRIGDIAKFKPDPGLTECKRKETGWHKRPSIFMPRWASRITLEITGVRVERVQDITNKSATAEGVYCLHSQSKGMEAKPYYKSLQSARRLFEMLWDSINAKRDGGIYAWDKNPWVWVIQFRKL